MWLKQPKQIAITYDNAVAYCRKLNYSGHAGWRLPTISELRRLSDTKRESPALPQGHPFSAVITHLGYWSKSKHKLGAQYVYELDMYYGKVGYSKKKDNAIVWPVRYADVSG